LPTITEAVTINVPGSSTFRIFIVDGQHLYRGFTIAAVPVTISGLTVQNAVAFGNLSGGGIYSEGDLTLSQVLVLNSAAGGRGGGVFSAGSLLVNGGLYEENSAALGGGGGIAADGDLVVIGSTVRGNQCTPALNCDGGGLNAAASLTLTNTVIEGNESAGRGGGAWATGPMEISGGRFEENSSVRSGGGFFANNGLTLDGTVIISNTAATDGGGGGFLFGLAHVANAHFEHNQSLDGDGGGGLLANNVDTMTVANVVFVGNHSSGGGGGLRSNHLKMDGGRFEQNTSNGSSGGLFAGNVVLTATQFISNTGAQIGGAVVGNLQANGGLFQGNQPGGLSAVSAVLTDTQFLTNSGGPGAAVGITVATGVRFANNSSPTLAGGLESGKTTLHDSEFVGNLGQSGGGVYATGDLTITSSLFEANSALMDGGGAYVQGNMVIDSSLFLRNSASSGGGIVHKAGNGLIVNTLLADNTATSDAALRLEGMGTDTLKHVTIARTGPGIGAALTTSKEILLLENTILADHVIGLHVAGGFVTLNSNLFHDNGLDTEGSIVLDVNHLVGDPKFTNPIGDNYHLQPGSAAINSGIDAGVASDVDGQPRPALGGFDIGFDELQEMSPELSVRLMLPFIQR
ncbi:MAG: choice-of-anchor Q domain-containing protein, partial [Chloroflexota bacterium]